MKQLHIKFCIEEKRENRKCCRHKNQNINICWTVGSVVSKMKKKKTNDMLYIDFSSNISILNSHPFSICFSFT